MLQRDFPPFPLSALREGRKNNTWTSENVSKRLVSAVVGLLSPAAGAGFREQAAQHEVCLSVVSGTIQR